MFYLDYSTVVDAYQNLLNGRDDNYIDSGLIGILFLLKNSQPTGKIVSSKRIPVDEKKVTDDINQIFSFTKPSNVLFNPDNFFILPEDYENLILDFLHGKKIDLLSVACVCMQLTNFGDELDPVIFKNTFVNEFNIPPSLLSMCFDFKEDSINLVFVNDLIESGKRKSTLEAVFDNPNKDKNHTITFKPNKDTFWQASFGGDFGRGAFTQKMRPSSNLKELLFLPNGAFQKQLSYQGITVQSNINPHSLNVLYFGPSGTGKSTEARRELVEDKGVNPSNIKQITFHPEYTYTDFVGSLKPNTLYKELNASRIFNTSSDKEMKYEGREPIVEFSFEAGPFVDICIKAANNEKSEPYALIIDEINRGNVPEILGDIFQLLDREATNYSNSNTELQKYLNENTKGNTFEKGLVIPNNLYIYATINPADQNVFPLDTAFKRRWKRKFWDINTAHEHCKDWHLYFCNKKVPWLKFITIINKFLTHTLYLSEDKQLGQFFIKLPSSPSLNDMKEEAVKVFSYLWEDIPKSKTKMIFNNILTFSELSEVLESDKTIDALFSIELAEKIRLKIDVESTDNKIEE
jgi:hypothetical protein